MVRFHGTDAAASREVDLVREVVLKDGLAVPRTVHELSWDGPDAIIVSHRVTDENGGTHWAVDRLRRGQSWEQATRLHHFAPDRVAASITRDALAVPARYMMTEWLDHRRRAYRVGRLVDGDLYWMTVPVPSHVRVQLQGDVALLIPMARWEIDGVNVGPGDLLAAPLAGLLDGTAAPRIVYRPAERERMLRLACTRNLVLLTVRDSDWTRLVALDPRTGDAREVTRVDASSTIRATPVDVTDDSCADECWVESVGPVTPPRLARADVRRPDRPWLIEEGQATFRHEDFAVRVHRRRRDPLPPLEYTVVAPAGMPLDGDNPTILSGYGGFQVSEHFDYLDLTGPTWLDRVTPGGRRCVFVFAHVGRRSDPRLAPWERLAASVQEFLDVAEQLTLDGITRSERLGALGVSHGALLVMNAMLSRPSAFGAVACRSGVLDLMRFPVLDGMTWTAEYGDPREPTARTAMFPVSPLHRISSGVSYPPMLLWSASDDDRVSPAHSRKMAARINAAGGTAFYLESAHGGHDALGSTVAGAHGLAITAAFFWRRLVDQAPQR